MSDLGDLLRRARAYKGATLRDAERVTRINRNYLAAIEAHDFDELPPRAYARGIVRNYAQYLGLDPAVVLKLYDEAVGDVDEDESEEVVPQVNSVDIHANWAPNFAIIAFMLIISFVAFTWIYSAYLQPAEEELPAVAVQPTATPVEESLLALVAETATADLAASASATPTGTEASTEEATEVPPTATSEPEQVESTSNDTSSTDSVENTESTGDSASSFNTVGDVETTGAHTFSVFADEEVWCQITINGGTVVFDGVLPADGWSDAFAGDTATITSGNADFIRVFVDGEDWGKLGGGSPWDAVVAYP